MFVIGNLWLIYRDMEKMLLNGGGWDGTKLEWFVRIELNIILNIYM
jgi:hypothetical protein